MVDMYRCSVQSGTPERYDRACQPLREAMSPADT
jgi:hypothetical protein